MNKFWPLFFMFWPVVSVVVFAISPAMGWWFPTEAFSPLGRQIDNLFYMILVIVGVVFVGTHIALGYVLWRAVDHREPKAWFTHGSHNLEMLWSIAPAGILIFISLYQLDVWTKYRIQSKYPKDMVTVAEVTARQFEWRIRYPAPGKRLMPTAQSDDLYTVNDLHVPVNQRVLIRLRSGDVQHSFFVPGLRIKQDAVPGQVIPVWFEASAEGDFDLTCAELCGWGHYKMRGRVLAEKRVEFARYMEELRTDQSYDGHTTGRTGNAELPRVSKATDRK